MRLLRYLIPLLLCVTAFGQGLRPFGVSTAVNNSAVYDTSSTQNIGANSSNAISTAIGSGLHQQGLFLLIGEDDTGPYYAQAASLLTVNNSTGALIPINWRAVGSHVSGNGNYHGECWMGTPEGGAAFSGTLTTTVLLTGTTGSPTQMSQWSYGYVNQGAISTAGSATCAVALSGANTVTLSASSDSAVFADYDTNNNRTATGCTTTTDFTGFGNTGYSGAHCPGTGGLTPAITWNSFSGTSIALAQGVPHDNGSSSPICAFEGYNPLTGGTSGTNIVSNLATLKASQHGNNPGTWAGSGTMNWTTTDTGLLNNTQTLCGDLTGYSSGTTAFGAVLTGTGSASLDNLKYTLPQTEGLASASYDYKFCSDAVTTDNFSIDVGEILINTDFDNVVFTCNGSICTLNIETPTTANTSVITYTTGGSCAAGGSGWVTIAYQINESGTLACAGGTKPCSYVKIYGNTGALLGSGTATAAGAFGSGDTVSFSLGKGGSETLTSGVHVYFAKPLFNLSGSFPPDI